MAINNEKDLGKAINDNQPYIEIEGDLVNKVMRIKATGKAAWIIAIGAVTVAATGLLYPVPEPTTQTVSKAFALTAAGGAVSVLGLGATITAISIAVAAGGVGALNKLRDYKVVSHDNGRLILKINSQ